MTMHTRVLDLGCGTGLHTRVLAQSSPATILAVDNHPPFVDELNHEAAAPIRDVATRVAEVEACGYDLVGHFTLPASSWWDDYYRPLQANVQGFRVRHSHEPDALALADRVQREIDVWHAYSDFYGYEFFVMRAR